MLILQSDTIHVPSPTELCRQCAVTLLNAGRYQDTLTVCDKVLTTADSGKPTENGMKMDFYKQTVFYQLLL